MLAAVNAQAQVSITDRQGTLLEVNDAFCQHTGYTREELIGRSHHLLNSGVHPRRFWADMWRQITDGKTWRQAVCNRTQQGTLYWVDVAITPIRNAAGQIETFVSLCTDITAAKQQEAEQLAAVRRGNALWEALQMHSLISMTDGNGVVTEANSAFCAMSGYRPAELIGQNHRLLDSGLHPASVWQAMWRDISNGWPWWAQLCNRAKDGTAYWLDTFIAPVHDANGQVQQYICIQQDLTASR